MAAGKLHADDTRVPVLAPGAVCYAYSADRGGEHPEQHLRTFRGALQADAYAGCDQLYKDGRIREVACWAHYPESGIIPSEL
jgi:Transposase IS66 family